MSIYAIHSYHQEVERIIHFGGTKKETSIRVAFQNLLNEYAKQKDLILIPEITIKTIAGNIIMPDGTLKDMLRLDWGYWESKDEDDDIDEEIIKKFNKGYPKDNILFEDSQIAILIQGGKEKSRVKMSDAEALDKLLHDFVNYERPEVKQFRSAIEKFKEDIPKVVLALRGMILLAGRTNTEFQNARKKFLKLSQHAINPDITIEDVREMMIQHILTEDIFNTIFDETQFHRENNIAHELELVINTFFKGEIKRKAFGSISHYYKAINAAAAAIVDHHEKQNFLKIVYETFYKSYNPKAADRLGVVYTPNEIVKFMIESTDYLLYQHFSKFLEDENVHILDPATGTGTFICDLIDHIRKEKLEHKYKNEIHSNEIAILPYYISNLNIEFTYNQKMGEYKEFQNHCFVDTLDNMGFTFRGKQLDLFDSISLENTVRIHKQNEKPIAVVIGNPPYNAAQISENDNNKNREYLELDKRIRETFVKDSIAQKTKVYDPYARFYRWAMDRLDDNGIIAFITNSSFLTAKGFDGFRSTVQNEFDYAYIIDLDGDLRNDTEQGKGNVFGITIGVCIAFMVKKKKATPTTKKEPCIIKYYKPNLKLSKEKLEYLNTYIGRFQEIPFEVVRPTKNNDWLNIGDNDFDELMPIATKLKSKSLFHKYANGVSTNRDEWVYDFDRSNLQSKSEYFVKEYNNEVDRWIKYKEDKNYIDIKAESNPIVDSFLHTRNKIKWSKMLKRDKLRKVKKGTYRVDDDVNIMYRPYVLKWLYFGYIPIDMPGKQLEFRESKYAPSRTICFSTGGRVPITALASNSIFDLNMFSPAPVSVLAFKYIDNNGQTQDNITGWGLNKFTKHYKTKKITREEIFHYIYAVLHNPVYRTKYELNLKREFPRIPFYEDFNKWSCWGKELMEMHINYENMDSFNLKEETDVGIKTPKAKLKAEKTLGAIVLDEATILTGIPAEAWEYKLGNRSAIEWILDQYKEKNPRDKIIADKFNSYKFSDYKTDVIKLLKKVCTVSVETVKIIKEMEKLEINL